MLHGDSKLRCDAHDGWDRVFPAFCPECQYLNADFSKLPLSGRQRNTSPTRARKAVTT